MASTPPTARVTWRDWLPVFSVLAIVIGAFMAMGGYVKQIDEQDRRIAALELRASDQDKTLREIQMTTTRTDATLQALRNKRGDLEQ